MKPIKKFLSQNKFTAIKQTKHNPDYKLVNVYIGRKELVYGISNDGKNEGLEVYFYRDFIEGHYRSSRYLQINVPPKYRTDYVNLRSFVREGLVKDGHKLSVKLNKLTNQ